MTIKLLAATLGLALFLGTARASVYCSCDSVAIQNNALTVQYAAVVSICSCSILETQIEVGGAADAVRVWGIPRATQMDIKPSKIRMISTALLYATLHQDATCTTSKLPRSRMRELVCFRLIVSPDIRAMALTLTFVVFCL